MTSMRAGTMRPRPLEGVDAELALDANAVAGLLQEVFALEMTASPAQCAHCGNEAQIGTLRAWVRGPGVVLRCIICSEVVLRIVQTPSAVHVDARGAAHLRFSR